MRFLFRYSLLAVFGLVLAGTAQPALAQQTITCSSDDGGRHTCPVDARGGVQMTNQRSGSACQQGYSWGSDRNGIWVDHGCRADFMVNSWNDRRNNGQTITCSSDDGGRHTCPVDARGGVQMTNQRSGSACQEGYSWGSDRNGIWVDHGCRADFMVNSWNNNNNWNNRGNGGQTITCSSDDGGRHTCPVDARGGVQMTNQRSGSACQQGYSWGYDRNGIWVDHGCRADFTVNSGDNRWDGGRGDGGGQTITCSSDDGGRHTCRADTRGGVQMTNQRSGSPCQQGYSWGYDRDGIWVDHGCRADFTVRR
jgi:hypothetical protein